MVTLCLDDFCNKKISDVIGSIKLKELRIGMFYNRTIEYGDLPEGLQILRIDSSYKKILQPNIIPNSVQTLILGNFFSQYLERSMIPDSCLNISINDSIPNTDFDFLPPSIENIFFPELYTKKLCPSNIPNNAIIYIYYKNLNNVHILNRPLIVYSPKNNFMNDQLQSNYKIIYNNNKYVNSYYIFNEIQLVQS